MNVLGGRLAKRDYTDGRAVPKEDFS